MINFKETLKYLNQTLNAKGLLALLALLSSILLGIKSDEWMKLRYVFTKILEPLHITLLIRANDIMQKLLLILMSVKFTEKHSIGEALQ